MVHAVSLTIHHTVTVRALLAIVLSKQLKLSTFQDRDQWITFHLQTTLNLQIITIQCRSFQPCNKTLITPQTINRVRRCSPGTVAVSQPSISFSTSIPTTYMTLMTTHLWMILPNKAPASIRHGWQILPVNLLLKRWSNDLEGNSSDFLPSDHFFTLKKMPYD